MKIIRTKIFHNFPLEAFIWPIGIAFLALINLENESSHISICPFAFLGIEFCPGCGLGRSINYLFNLNFSASFSAHPLGLPALLVLLFRSIYLIKSSIKISTYLGEISNGKSFTFNAQS